jgi:hypothetical protein
MRNSIFCFLFVLFINESIFSQQPVIAKAPPLIMLNHLKSDEANSVVETYNTLLSEAQDVRVINQLVLEKEMRDYYFQQKDWSNIEKTAALGEVLNVDWVVRPQIQKRAYRDENVIIVMAALLDIKTRKIRCTKPVILKYINEARAKLNPLINEITQIITRNEGDLSQSDMMSVDYKIGDRGPAGGWVFYDKGNYSNGWRFLEVAPREIEKSLDKNNYGEKIRGTDKKENQQIGSGKQNTEIIIQANQNYQKDYQIIKAASICVSLELNWFKDWFLPSSGELNILRSLPNPKFGGPDIGGFNTGYYISSTTWTSDDSVGFWVSGERSPDRNQKERYVRAIRAF